ncbi:MAG: penicillin acylase family protein [Cyanobacteria bacterium P01_G01_bin.67]
MFSNYIIQNNPESGYIVTANNHLTPGKYPYQINPFFPEPYRAIRISELLVSKEKLSLANMQDNSIGYG